MTRFIYQNDIGTVQKSKANCGEICNRRSTEEPAFEWKPNKNNKTSPQMDSADEPIISTLSEQFSTNQKDKQMFDSR